MTLLPGGITDFYGGTNSDTLRRNLVILSEKQLTSITVTAKNLKPGSPYVFQLLNGTAVEVERIFDATGTEQRIALPNLPVANYGVRLVEDQNRNGRWDPGHYFDHRQPEPLTNVKLEPSRANWELEASVQMGGIPEKQRGGGKGLPTEKTPNNLVPRKQK